MQGGAVELSWKLRATSGSEETFLDCTPTKYSGIVRAIRLDWDVDGETGHREWPCEDDHGVTGFQLPEGTALLRVSPVCDFGAAALDTYTAPAPEQRDVISGATISLGGVELLLEVSSCPSPPCICTAVPLTMP